MDNKKSIIAIIILIIMVLGLSGYIVYDKFFKEKEETEYTNVVDDVSIDINKLYKVGNILDRFDKAFNINESKYFGYAYKFKTLDVKDFDKNAAIYVSIYNDLIKSNTEQRISSARIKNRYEMIFGKTLAYTPNSIDITDNNKIAYDDTNKTYKYTVPITDNDHKPEYLVRNIKTKLKDDLVIITRKVFYVEYTDSKANIYTNSNKENLLGEVTLKNGEVSKEEVTGKYGSKIPTYDFTFKIGSDDEYNIYRIERTK
ncbi:MAG: hypothetical protein IJ097_00185 [Bacilli bacterium]|nr:hypothetical protein [Bacilli bacterium]